MKLSKEQQAANMAWVRKLMVVRHDMPIAEMRERLSALGVRLDPHYIGRLREKIIRERNARMNRETLNAALAAFQDVMMEVAANLWIIALDPSASRKDRVAALREIRNAHAAAFDKLFDAGVFERKLGTLDLQAMELERRRQFVPSPEQLETMRSAFRAWGMLPEPDAPNHADALPEPTEPVAA